MFVLKENFFYGTCKQEISSQKITVQYNYDFPIWLYDGTTGQIDMSKYVGKKIYTIGFSHMFTNSQKVCCIIDVSNYNIYYDETFNVTRADIITSDAMFYSPFSDILGPVHLAPFNLNGLDSSKNTEYSIIYSVGLSSYTDRMDVEFILGENIEWEVDEDNAQIIIYDLQNKEEHSLLQANPLLYCNNQLMPVMVEGGQQYKYIIVKYKLWEENVTDDVDYVDTDEWYYQAIPIDETNMLTLRIKYERG